MLIKKKKILNRILKVYKINVILIIEISGNHLML